VRLLQQRKAAEVMEFKDLPEEIPLPLVIGTRVTGEWESPPVIYSPVTHTHTHTFNGPLSGTAQVSRYQKCKTNLDFTEARDSDWQWHQLGHMQVCTSLQADNYASNHQSTTQFFTGRMAFLLPSQQRQSIVAGMEILRLLTSVMSVNL